VAPTTRRFFAHRGTAGALVALVALTVAGFMACDKTMPDPVCTFTLTPPAGSFTADGGNASVAVTASTSSCAWTASANAGWITILSGASGVGNGGVNYRVAANTATDVRTATIAVDGSTHAITQQGAPPVACTFSIAPTAAMFDDRGGSGDVQVTAPAGCTWTAESQAAFLSITTGASGSGSGTVTYGVAENNTAADRTGTLRVAGETFTVTQTSEPVACDYTVSPVSLTPCMAAGSVLTTVTAPASCTFTVSTNVPWLTVTNGSAGSGTTQVQVAYSANYDPPRSGTIMVRWPTPTQGQNVQVNQAGCYYGVSQSAFSFAAGGGNGAFMVLQQSDPIVCGGPLQNGCVWTPSSDVSWITISMPGQHIGDDQVSFTVAANGTGSTRVGTIRVRDRVVMVTQN